MIMEEPFLAEIKFIPAPVVPDGWAWCNGCELRIADYPALFELLGTTFGGDGKSTFALPNLVGRKPMQIAFHAEMPAIVKQPPRRMGLERSTQPHAVAPTYESTYFCIALKGIAPVHNRTGNFRPTFP